MPRDIDYIKFKNAQDLNKICVNLKELFDRQEFTNTELRKQLEELKTEKWADEKLQKMKAQLDRMEADYWRGFPISKDETEAISKWKAEHDAEEHNNPEQYHGVSGGGYVYKFCPTAIGTVGTCICSICHDKANEIAAVNNGVFSKELYRLYMKKHHGIFDFKEL